MQKERIIKIIVVIAKIWSVLVIGFVLFMFIGSALGEILGEADESIEETGFRAIELFAALFFPIGMCIGMIVGWKRHLPGGLITVISMIIFSCLILIPREVSFDRGAWIFILLGFPGVLFSLAGVLKRYF